jgi:hypothetical protein
MNVMLEENGGVGVLLGNVLGDEQIWALPEAQKCKPVFIG